MKRKIYLDMQPLAAAQKIFWSRFRNHRTKEETIPCRRAAGRVTATPVTARLSAPAFHSAAMDGLAVRADQTFGASDETPLVLDIQRGQAEFINTGHPMPAGKDAVIMIEHVLVSEDGKTGVIRAPVFPWQNVRKAGEDIVATELLFTSNHLLKPADVAALLTSGHSVVSVYRKPDIVIIPTGSELVDLKLVSEPESGKTIESNSAVLAAMAEECGARARIMPIIRDEYSLIRKVLLDAVHSEADMVVINAGSSAGSSDHTVRILEELGEVLVHGVTIMPGKPTILGAVAGKPVVGNPGYPVSAIISFEQFVIPLLCFMQGKSAPEPAVSEAVLARDIPSRSGIEEFRRMIAGRIGRRLIAVPLKKGAGAITTLTRANAILRIPASSEGESQGSQVTIELLRPGEEVDRTILCTGSHDLCLDILHDFLRSSTPAYPLASTHVGSTGGIMAVRDCMTHIAGSHLLDPVTGEYNISYIRKYLEYRQVSLFTLVHRQQGLMVRPGNPMNIRSVHDLLREDLVFINRQQGSGTRVLLDYKLEENGLDPDLIRGYTSEEYTHMAVAMAVLSGKADTGLGILAAARALGLDFISVAEERYDLIIPENLLSDSRIIQILKIINTTGFKQRVEAMGGYSTRETGRTVTWCPAGK